MRHAVIVGLVLLGACVFAPEPPVACGEWPAVMVWPAEPERAAEERYRDVLERWDVSGGGITARFIFDTFASVTFFRAGERLAVVRAGDLEELHVLVARHADRLWTHHAELC